MPPLGLGYLASIAKKEEYNTEILDCPLLKTDFKKFEELLHKKSYDVIGIHVNTFNLTSVKKHISIIKGINPKTIVIVGGSHPSCDPKGTMEYFTKADYAFQGEAEIGFKQLLDLIKQGKLAIEDLSKVSGLVWRQKETVKINPIVFITNLDELEFPLWELMNPNWYPEAPHGGFVKNFPAAPLIITRGCPYNCTFCVGGKISGKIVRKRSVQNTIKEIVYLKKVFGVKEILVEDENFTMHKETVKEFCEELIRQDIGVSWSLPSGIRIDTVDKELLELMEKSGCYSVAFGIEFGSQRILNLCKKGTTIKGIREKLTLFKKSKIKITGFFMLGYPTETIEEIKKTIDFALELPLHKAQFNNFLPLPYSQIYCELREQKKIGFLDTDHFFMHDVAFTPDGITKKQLKGLQRNAYLKFYLRPKIILNIISEIRSFRHLTFLVNRFLDALK